MDVVPGSTTVPVKVEVPVNVGLAAGAGANPMFATATPESSFALVIDPASIVFVTVAVSASVTAVPLIFVLVIAAEALMSALTIVPSAIFPVVTAPSYACHRKWDNNYRWISGKAP